MEIPEGYATSSTDPYEKPAADIVERVNKDYNTSSGTCVD